MLAFFATKELAIRFEVKKLDLEMKLLKLSLNISLSDKGVSLDRNYSYYKKT